MEIKFADNSPQVLEEFHAACLRALEKCGLAGEKYAKLLINPENSTGNLRNSITHQVVADEKAVYIGSGVKYAVYVELGTGIYYDNGGRQDPWVYRDDEGRWHWTRGNKAKPFLKPAVADHARTYQKIIEGELKHG